VKSIRNEPVINEITEDDVNGLSDQIRQLKVLSSPAGVIIKSYFEGCS
jgi:kinesin family protein 15